MQNKTLWNIFQRLHQSLKKEKIEGLWHAGPMEAIKGITNSGMLCHWQRNQIFSKKCNVTGFCGLYNTVAAYGRGTYLATNASYSANDRYSPRASDGFKRMLYCHLTVGEKLVGSSSYKVPQSIPGQTYEISQHLRRFSHKSCFC